MKRQLWQEQFNCRDPDEEPWKQSLVKLCKQPGRRLPSEVSDSAHGLGPSWVVVRQASGDERREVFKAERLGRKVANELHWGKPG